MANEKPEEEVQNESETDKTDQVPNDEPVTFFITDPFEMMKRLGRRPTDEQLKKYEQQEKRLQKKSKKSQGDQTEGDQAKD